LTHLVLLELVSGKDDHAIGVPGLENLLEECSAEGASSTGDEERGSVEDWHGFFVSSSEYDSWGV
jgi:hypothetical protein